MTLYALLLQWYKQGIKTSPPPIFDDNKNTNHIFISVIVAMRNEAENITQCLHSLTAQTYPHHEIILINDHSTDHTHTIATQYPNPKITLINAQNNGKKAAIQQAIQQAKGTHIAITDADCTPQPQWLALLAHTYAQYPETQLISAPVQLTTPKNSNFFQKIQVIEFAGLNAIGAACIHHAQPNMCNGANLSYKKSAFDAVHGFEGNAHLASGDDEFLMHKIFAHYRTGSLRFLAHTQAIVYTPAITNLRPFFAQRKRWASKSGAYKNKNIIAQMLLVFIVNCSITAAFILGYWHIALAQIIAKYLCECNFYSSFAAFYNLKKWRTLLFLGQWVQIPYLIAVALSTLHKGYEWKGRRVQ
jgi:cellulose synthase/poly-beta-1,6-N-acetylglucosamine synthase-like glycosyltransferase